MSSVSNKKVTPLIDDVQSRVDTRNIPIDRVGIRSIRHPISIRMRDGKLQNTVGEFSMYVNLAHDTKGTHMSRFVELLHGEELALCPSSFRMLLESMTQRLEAERGHIEVRFAYFVAKKAPVSGVVSYLDYQVSLIGEIGDAGPEVRVKVIVPVTSLCPCSKEISKYGAHNQRSHVTVDALVNGDIAIEDLIDICEEQASCELYGILKRPDEKYVTERAYENPKFVEDMVRDVAAALNANVNISQYTVESENFESIHNHSAYATITFDKRG